MKQNKLRTLYEKDMTKKILASLLSILIGLVVGSVIIAAVGFSNPELGASSVWDGIRIVFGLAVLGCLMSVVLKLLQAEFPAWGWLLGPMATVEVLGFVSAISIYIAVKMVQGAKAELAAKKMRAANS